jgi:hypothetical protein
MDIPEDGDSDDYGAMDGIDPCSVGRIYAARIEQFAAVRTIKERLRLRVGFGETLPPGEFVPPMIA